MLGRGAAILIAVGTMAGCSLAQGGLSADGAVDGDGDAARDGAVQPDGGPGDGGPDSGPGDDGGSDAAPDDSGCVDGTVTCAGGIESRCVGGAWMDETCPFGCATTATRCAKFVPSNVSADLLMAGAADRTISTNELVDTSDCNPSDGLMPVDQIGGPQLCVAQVGALTITATLAVFGERPLVIVASGPVRITGAIDVSSYTGRPPGPGGGRGGIGGSGDGLGPNPGVRGLHVGSFDDGSGGGGGLCGTGGEGGSGGSAAGGAGGGSVTDWTLSPLYGGSGGGAGGQDRTDGEGGAGGGALQITSGVSITISGAIFAGGAGGEAGLNCCGNWGCAGSGGSGGAVLLEAPAITITSGGAPIVATGGGGGGSASDAGHGTDGQNGAEAATRAAGGVAGGAYGSAGGLSGGSDTLDGEDGGDNGSSGANGGGAGGGAGCILLRTASGDLPDGATRSSPSVGPGLRALRVRTD